MLSDVGKQLWPRYPGPAGVAADEPWHDHVEADARVAAVPGRVGEQGEELEVAADRVWPAVQQQQRGRVGAGAASMDEGKGLTGELGRVVRERVEVGLLPAPVVAVLPIGGCGVAGWRPASPCPGRAEPPNWVGWPG